MTMDRTREEWKEILHPLSQEVEALKTFYPKVWASTNVMVRHVLMEQVNQIQRLTKELMELKNE